MFNKYPYTDFHELNLDWILNHIKELEHAMSDFEALNKITFSGAWDITKQYPAWTIVNDNGAGYVSIRPVPAGALLTDNTYWRGVVDYTETIADLQNRVVNLENTVGDSSSGLVKDVSDLQTDVSSLKHKLLVVIGDSYTTHDPTTPGVITWPKNMGEWLVDYGFVDEQYSFGADGTRYSASSSNNFYQQIITASADTSFDNNQVDYVLIEGGQNERFETGYDTASFYNTLVARVRTTVEKAKAEFPNAKVVVVPMAWNGKQLKVEPYLNIFNAIYDGASSAGAIVDRSSLYWGYDANYTWESDGGHPTYQTMQYMTQKLGTILDGGYVGCPENYIFLPNTNFTQERVEYQGFKDGLIKFTVTGYNSTALTAGDTLGYVYPGFSNDRNYGYGFIDAYGEKSAIFYQTVDASFTGTVKCLRNIAAGDRFTFTFEYQA